MYVPAMLENCYVGSDKTTAATDGSAVGWVSDTTKSSAYGADIENWLDDTTPPYDRVNCTANVGPSTIVFTSTAAGTCTLRKQMPAAAGTTYRIRVTYSSNVAVARWLRVTWADGTVSFQGTTDGATVSSTDSVTQEMYYTLPATATTINAAIRTNASSAGNEITVTAWDVTPVYAARQETSGYKPTISLQSGSTSRYELKFDGTDDRLVCTSGPRSSSGLVMVWAGKINTAIADATTFSWYVSESDRISLKIWSTPSVRAFCVLGGVVSDGMTPSAITVGSSMVVTLRLTSTQLSMRINGGAWAHALHNATPSDLSGAASIGALNGLRKCPQTNAFAYIGNLGTDATDSNIRTIELAAAAAVGVTI